MDYTETPRGERLRHFIKMRFGTQKAFAEAIGKSTTQVSFWCNDEQSPGMDVLQLWREAGLSLDWYASGEGSMDATEVKPEIVPVDFGDVSAMLVNRDAAEGSPGQVKVAPDTPIAERLQAVENSVRNTLMLVEDLRKLVVGR